MAANGEDPAKTIGEVLDQVEVVKGRSFENWRSEIGAVRAALVSMAGKAKERNDTGEEEMANHHAATLQAVYDEMDRAAKGWVSTREELDGRTAYADLQNKIIDGWPRGAVADRLFYLGTGLIGGGGIVYAILGGTGLIEYAALWAAGIFTLLVSLRSLGRYDADRAKHFAELRNRVR